MKSGRNLVLLFLQGLSSTRASQIIEREGESQQKVVQEWADNLDVKFEVINNIYRANASVDFPDLDDDTAFEFQITFEYSGNSPIVNTWAWAIYFYMDQTVLRPEPIPIHEAVSIGNGLDINHVNGYLWRVAVNDEWTPLRQGESRRWNLHGDDWIVGDSTLFPNWYIACEDQSVCDPTTITSTVDITYNKPNYVAPLDKLQQVKRDELDQVDIVTVESIYDDNERLKVDYSKACGGKACKECGDRKTYGIPILPTPAKVTMDPSELQLDKNNGCKQVPKQGVKINEKIWFYSYQEQVGHTCENPVCDCSTDNSGKQTCKCDVFSDYQQGSECVMGETCRAWEIQIGFTTNYRWQLSVAQTIRLAAADCDSAWEAVRFVQKMIQKLNSDPESMLFIGEIADFYPRFETRAIFLDHARNFHGKETVMELLEVMSGLNLNQLHMRLSDDEGWRLEIEGLEELTTIGANRCHDPIGDKCIMPQLGSGPTTDSTGSGFLSKADYIDILQRGKKYGIRIVPEIVAPGHNAAAITAMEARFRKTKDATYRLIDPEQEPSNSSSVQNFYNNVMNPCVNGTTNFLVKVLEEIFDMHKSFMGEGLHNHFHIGGDETDVSQWAESPACQKLGQDGQDLLHAFFKKYIKMVADKGFHVDGWEEVWEYEKDSAGQPCSGDSCTGLYAIYPPEEWGVDLAKTKLTGYHWNNMWLEQDTPTTGYMMANAGYNVVMAPATHIYLDHAQYPDPNARGLLWATRFSNLWKAFSLRPMDLYKNGLYDYWQNKINSGCEPGKTDKGVAFECTILERPENIVGISGCLWSEELVKKEFLWNQMFPRAYAIAERSHKNATWELDAAGSKKSWDIFDDDEFKHDFALFRYAMQYELRILEDKGIEYHLPKPGGKVVGGQWKFNNLYTHNDIMFRVFGTTNWLPYGQVKDTIENTKTEMEMVTVTFARKSNGQPVRTSQPIRFNTAKPKGDKNSASLVSLSGLLLCTIFML